MTNTRVYVFAGKFKHIDEACLYSEPQWEPEPDESVTDEEYTAWENRNPTHGLKNIIGPYLDEDFIETIELDYIYLETLKIKKENITEIKKTIKEDSNIFVLVYEQALGGFELANQPLSTVVLTY